MARSNRGLLWVALVLLAAVCGCDLATMSYFLMPEPRQPPQLKRLASDGKKVKVVLLADMGLETRPEFDRVDMDLCVRLGGHLKQLFAENQEDVELVPQREVEQFKATHPSWRDLLPPAEVGKHFGADTVVYIELRNLALYEKGSGRILFKGQADLTLSVIDVKHPDEMPARKNFSCVYPSDARGGVSTSDMGEMEFRQNFLDYLARRLSWNFAAYRKRDTYFVE
jgi:hypothetical protein